MNRNRIVFLALSLLLAACGKQEPIASSPVAVIDVTASLTGPPLDQKNLGALATAYTVNATLSSQSATQMQTSEYVTVTFGNGERFSYENRSSGGTFYSVYDKDMAFARTSDMPTLVAQYQSYLNTHIRAQSIILKGAVDNCTFEAIDCWKSVPGQTAWPSGFIFYQFDPSITPSQKEKFVIAAKAFNERTGYRPVMVNQLNRNGGPTMIISPAFLGYSGGVTPQGYTRQGLPGLNRMWLSDTAFNDQPLLIHEMGHAAGLLHEQQRCDRDGYVNINVNTSVVSYYFNYAKACFVGQEVGPFDYSSHMIYHATEGVTAKTSGIGTNKTGDPGNLANPVTTTFSNVDIEGLRVLYPATNVTNYPPVSNFGGGAFPVYCKTAFTAVFNFNSLAYDADGEIVSYKWIFPDGTTSVDPNPVWKTKVRGFYNFTLTVTDDRGATASKTKMMSVDCIPTDL